MAQLLRPALVNAANNPNSLDVFVADAPIINPVVFDCWLRGLSLEQTFATVISRQHPSFAQKDEITRNQLQVNILHEINTTVQLLNTLKPIFQSKPDR